MRFTFNNMLRRRQAIVAVVFFMPGVQSISHEPSGHGAPTYEITQAIVPQENERRLRLEILDSKTKRPMAARFILEADGEPFIPPGLDKQGIRFTSIHQRKNERNTVLYPTFRASQT